MGRLARARELKRSSGLGQQSFLDSCDLSGPPIAISGIERIDRRLHWGTGSPPGYYRKKDWPISLHSVALL